MEATTFTDETNLEFAFAASVGDDPGPNTDKTVKIRLPAFPGEDALSHEGERWRGLDLR